MSVFRILLAPVLVVLVLSEDDTPASVAAAVFVFGALTDGLDGYLARRYSGATTIGQWLDPLADKILVSAPVIALSVTGAFPVWAAVIIVGREIAVSLLRVWLGTRGIGMPASPWGKAKTAVQMVLVPLYLLPLGPGADSARRVVLALTVALTLWSGLDYFLGAGRRARMNPS
ncbi:MAG: CDP-diacylglycerol--glycerol-3-phosphate 3-phosphatidyltransferase [Actinomycetota bacterium]